MKKTFIILIIGCLLTLFSCGNSVLRSGNSKGIPTEFNNLEFYNGGGLIAKFGKCRMSILISTRVNASGASAYYYLYEVTPEEGEKVTIMDSEALSLKWW
jgi:hypothetical protein